MLPRGDVKDVGVLLPQLNEPVLSSKQLPSFSSPCFYICVPERTHPIGQCQGTCRRRCQTIWYARLFVGWSQSIPDATLLYLDYVTLQGVKTPVRHELFFIFRSHTHNGKIMSKLENLCSLNLPLTTIYFSLHGIQCNKELIPEQPLNKACHNFCDRFHNANYYNYFPQFLRSDRLRQTHMNERRKKTRLLICVMSLKCTFLCSGLIQWLLLVSSDFYFNLSCYYWVY